MPEKLAPSKAPKHPTFSDYQTSSNSMMLEPSSSEPLRTFSARSQRPFVLENSGVVLNDDLVRTIPHGSTVRLHGALLPFTFPDDTVGCVSSLHNRQMTNAVCKEASKCPQ